MKRLFLPFLSVIGLTLLAAPAFAAGASAAGTPPVIPPGLADAAARKETQGQYKSAAADYGKLAALTATDAEKSRFLLKQADSLFQARRYGDARDVYRNLIENYASLIPLEQVLVTQRELASRFASGKASALRVKRFDTAIEIYRTILKVAPSGAKAPADMLRLGELQMQTRDTAGAIVTYRDVVRRFPRAPEAASAQLAIAKHLLTAAARSDGDGRYTRQARAELTAFLQKYPDHPETAAAKALLARADESQARRLVALAKFYLRPLSHRPAAARRYLYDAVHTYASTRAAAQATALLATIEPGTEAGGEGVAGTDEGEPAATAAAEAPLETMKYLQQQEGVQKYLRPLEDFSEYQRKK